MPDIMETFGAITLLYLVVVNVAPSESLRDHFYDSIEQPDRRCNATEGPGSLTVVLQDTITLSSRSLMGAC